MLKRISFYLQWNGLLLAFAAIAFNARGQTPSESTDAAASDLVTYRIAPSTADPTVTDFDQPNLVVFDRHTTNKAPLAIFLPGTNGRPDRAQGLLRVIAGQGYRVIGLQYDDEPAVVQVCPRNPNPGCSAAFRRERIFGNEDEAPISNPLQETIVARLVRLLKFLDAQHPDEGWAGYVDGNEPVWSRIVVSGLSQGAGMAAYIAKQRTVARVVLFSSPWDFHGPGKMLAPWLKDPSATPPERWFAEYHARENTAALIALAYDRLKIPADHILVFDHDLPDSAHGQNPFHPSTVHLLDYAPQWRQLYGTAVDAP